MDNTNRNTHEFGELLIFQSEDGSSRIKCRFVANTLWLRRALLADLYQVSVPTVNEHFKIFTQRVSW